MPLNYQASLSSPSFRNTARPLPKQESMVADDRESLRPSEVVQMKLLDLLPVQPIPVSSLHTYRDCRR
jgi:hypothetical protein